MLFTCWFAPAAHKNVLVCPRPNLLWADSRIGWSDGSGTTDEPHASTRAEDRNFGNATSIVTRFSGDDGARETVADARCEGLEGGSWSEKSPRQIKKVPSRSIVSLLLYVRSCTSHNDTAKMRG